MKKYFLLFFALNLNLTSQNLSTVAIEKLESFIKQEMNDKKITSLSISVVTDKKIIYENGFGFFDKDEKIPTNANTNFRVGSISKIFTAIGVMQLAERGILNIDEPIEKIIPEFHPKNNFNIPQTLRQFMSHRSGLLREPPIGSYFDATEPTLKKTVLSTNNIDLIYPPKSNTKYSNAGVAINGFAIEKATGMNFENYLRDSVLNKIGMENSDFKINEKIKNNLSKSFMWSFDGRFYDAPVFKFGWNAAGNLYSTTHDLAKFLQVCFNDGNTENGKLISKKSLNEMWKVQFSDEKTGFGLGFYIGNFNGHKTIQHGGAVYGNASTLIGLPNEKIGVAVISNIDVTNIVANRIAQYALNLFFAEKNNNPLPEFISTEKTLRNDSRKLQGQYKNKKGDVIELYSRPFGLQIITDSQIGTLKLLNDTLIFDDRQFFGPKVLKINNGIIFKADTFLFVGNPKPKEAKRNYKNLIGEYGFDNLPLIVFERFGKLQCLIELTEMNPLTEINVNEYGFPKNYNMYESEKIIFNRSKNKKGIEAKTASIKFPRRFLMGETDKTFAINPLKPINELENIAKSSSPPIEENKFESELIEVSKLSKEFKYDIRYASDNNFMKNKFYSSAKAYLQIEAAQALVNASKDLKKYGFGIMIFDAYRPWYVTKMFWDATPEHQKIFVANPAKGSRHNRGCAIDLTLYDLKTGLPVDMVGQYDEMSERSFPDYVGGTSLQRWHRELLRTIMEANGFNVYEYEWWHFDFRGWEKYPINNKTFEEIQN